MIDPTTEKTLRTIGEAIRAARIERGLSQQELADLVDMNRQYLVDLEHGRSTTQLRRLMALLHAVGLDIVVRERTGR